jgi:lipoprotein-anchoring transpeptidase ErfK/SrfK
VARYLLQKAIRTKKSYCMMFSRLSLLIVILLACVATGPAAQAVETVSFTGYPAGSIVVKTLERRLYYVVDAQRALRFRVAVGMAGRQWQGQTRITRKIRNPVFVPPAFVRREKPSLPVAIPPGPANPLGAAVFVLGGGRYGIHGTNKPQSIGKAASYGCIRMRNEDILALYGRVRTGTPVIVTN